MKFRQDSRTRTRRLAAVCVAFLCFPKMSSAFLPLCGRKFGRTALLLLPKHQESDAKDPNIEREKTSSFGSMSTRICMVGPISSDEEFGLVGESPSASPVSPVAHGLLCPETIHKMEEAMARGRGNPAIKGFLDRYHRLGPMSCMELLSDPEILPHLTNTMRDLAEERN